MERGLGTVYLEARHGGSSISRTAIPTVKAAAAARRWWPENCSRSAWARFRGQGPCPAMTRSCSRTSQRPSWTTTDQSAEVPCPGRAKRQPPTEGVWKHRANAVTTPKINEYIKKRLEEGPPMPPSTGSWRH